MKFLNKYAPIFYLFLFVVGGSFTFYYMILGTQSNNGSFDVI